MGMWVQTNSTVTRLRAGTFGGASPSMPTSMTFDPDWKNRPESKTRVVNILRAAFDVYIGRAGRGEPGYFGNPHRIGRCQLCETVHGRNESIAQFKKDFLERVEQDAEFRERVKALKGKTLGCFCKPLPCHGDIIVEWLDSQPNS